MSAESAVEQYKGAIGLLSAGRTREELLGFRISYRDLLSAFDIVRAVKNEFKRMDIEEAEAKSKRGSSASTGARPGGPKKVMGA